MPVLCPSFVLWLLLLLLHPLSATLSLAAPSASIGTARTKLRSRADFVLRADDDPCAAIFADNDRFIFLAQDAYNCLVTVPFNATIAAQFVQYLKDTVVFQSTLAYLRNPPPSYQQPPVDILSALDAINANVAAGVYQNEYAFEAAVGAVIVAAHDGHLNVDGGALAVFSFGSPYAISSVSLDGIQIPQVYLTDDLYSAQGSNNEWTPSPIKAINGQNVNQFLVNFAANNSFGLLERNSDWNALMYSPAADIQGLPSVFTGQSSFYPGNDLTFLLENGTQVECLWQALAYVPYGAPPINNGVDFFNYFILNEIPEDDGSSSSSSSTTVPAGTTPTATPSSPSTVSTSAPSSSPSSQAPPVLTSWGVIGYPSNPDVIQPDLGNGGFITGYFLNETKLGVLSIPSFEMTGSAITTFSNTIGEFIRRSQEAGMTQIVIDLQQNYGGDVLLATDTFKQFFPPVDPFGGSRLRSFDFSDALGTTYTQYYSQNTLNQSYADAFLDIPWAVLDYIDADNNQNFTSWPEFFGPHADNGDFFSTVQRDNLSSSLFDEVASGGFDEDGTTPTGIVIYGYGNRSTKAQPPYAPEDMIILTDGVCHSACAVFVEMMHHEAFVRTVVVGGQPNIGAMQAVAGTRGALEYSTDDLDNDMYAATIINSSVTNYLPASHVTEDLLFWLQDATFNLRDQIRQGPDNYFPLQFAYEAADCRIYWTLSTFNNFANLWQYAADAVWTNSNSCVSQSTDFPTTRNGVDTVGPSVRQKAGWSVSGVMPINTTTPSPTTSLIPFPDYSATPTPTSLTPTQTSSTSAKISAIEGVSEADDIANDSLNLKSTTLDKHCNPKSRNPCTPRSNELCLEVAICTNGQVTTDTQCKRQCTSSSQCTSANGQATFCNIYDQRCSISTNGQPTCSYLNHLAVQVGSGSTRSTVQNSAGSTVTRYAAQGFCEQLVRTDAACQALADTGNGAPLPPSPSLAAIAASGFGSIIVDVPTTPDEQQQGNTQQLDNVENDAVKTPKAVSVGDFVNLMFGV